MYKATLTRYFSDERITLGNLKIEGIKHKPFYTLENPWLNNKKNISCIPSGKYNCEPFDGVKFKGVYILNNVPNRNFILIHPGTFERHTQGCILIGNGINDSLHEPFLIDSRNAFNRFKEIIENNDFIINIDEKV